MIGGAPACQTNWSAGALSLLKRNGGMSLLAVEKIRIHSYLNKEMHMEFEGIHITITRFTRIDDDSAWEIPAHAHMNYELHYIYEGSGKVGLGNNIFDISKGEFYICPPFIDHSQSADAIHPMKEYCIECALDIPLSDDGETEQNKNFFLLQMINRILYCKHSDSKETLKRNFDLLDKMLGENSTLDEGDELLAKSLILHTILSMLISSKKDSDDNSLIRNRIDVSYQRASSIKNYLEANYKQNITVRDCARIFYLSERQIDRILTKVFDETFHEMLTKTRVNIGINLMQTTDYSVDVVATEAGFSGYRQMLRSFKRYGVEQPTRLRKDYRWNEANKI